MNRTNNNLDISSLRCDYKKSSLRRNDLSEDPIFQFKKWFDESIELKLLEPNAMVLSTIANDSPSSRTVLLKEFNAKGFVFFTNYESDKALEIYKNPNVSLLFPWYTIERQVIIKGFVEKVTTDESLNYFKSRPLNSQLGAWVSHQSRVIPSRLSLERRLSELKNKFSGREIPKPNFWGGFRIKPTEFEFWQGRENRLHDRFRYKLKDFKEQKEWLIERISP